MTLDIVYGETRNRETAIQLAAELAKIADSGTVYLGYPVLSSVDDRVYVDALLVCREHGLVAFKLGEGIPASEADWAPYVTEQDRLFGVLESHLGRHEALRRGRHLAVPIETITVFPSPVGGPPTADGRYIEIDEVDRVVGALPEIDEDVFLNLQAAIQRVTTIKPAKRRNKVVSTDSRGAVLKEIEKGIANLDRWQKRAAIETPDGPQRIRGLAGSGKTVVLALKAAYLHAQHPNWRIVMTFQSRALYQQLEDLVTRFSFEHSDDRPDFEHLQILHGWGSSARDGVYAAIAREVGATPRDFGYAQATYGRDDAFRGVCQELLTLTEEGSPAALFDAVLIDEAQDFPPEFFRLIYRFTKDPKRIVWAFDELQKLSESAMPATDELFGTTSSGDSLVSLTQRNDEAARDIVLPICYRNSPWSLATAHALGFGIYRNGGLIQHFDDPRLWADIGYNVLTGRLATGSDVQLERARTSYPDYFPELLDASDAVLLRTFRDEAEQDVWVAEQIATNLKGDELEHDDLLVVLPDAYTAKRRSTRLARTLERFGVESHLAGVGSSVDQVFVRGSVAIAHIFRAKGNEAPMVYVLDAQEADRLPNLITRRNTMFTAVTRSKAWVRICGWGDRMNAVAREVEAVQENAFRLAFRIPTMEELAVLRRIHRERSDAEVAWVKRATRNAKELLEAFERGEIDLEDLPPELRTRLWRLMREAPADDTE